MFGFLQSMELTLPWGSRREEGREQGVDSAFHMDVVGLVVTLLSSHQERNKNAAQELATLLLSLPAPASVQQQSKSLLASLHTSRSAYHSHKVIVPSWDAFCGGGSWGY